MRYSELFEANSGYYLGVIVGKGNFARVLLNNDGPYPTGQAALNRGALAAVKYEWVIDNLAVLGDLTPDQRNQIALDPATYYEADDTDVDEDDDGYGIQSHPFNFSDYDPVSMNSPDEHWGGIAVFHVCDEGTVLVKDSPLTPRDFNGDFDNFMKTATGKQ